MPTPDAGPHRPTPAWLHILLLTVAGVLLRVVLRGHFGLDAAFGEDAEFWGYRAIELQTGTLWGTHPPLYPAIVALLSRTAGITLTGAANAVSLAAGVCMAPAIAFAMTPLAGRGAAVLVGWFVLLFPGLLAISLRVEPTGVFVLWIAAILYAASRGLRDLSVPWAVTAGLLIAASSLVKENGLLYCGLLVPVVGFALLRRRWLLAVLPILAVALPLALLDRAPVRDAPGAEVSVAKASIPLLDLKALLYGGVVPAPLLGKEDRHIALPRDAKARLTDPATAPVARAWIYAGLQARRLWRFLGVWLIVAPVAFYGLFRMWRAGTIEPWRVAMILGLTATLAPAILFIVQARHAEPCALGILAAAAIALVHLRARRVAIPAALVLLGAQGAWLFGEREAAPIRYLARCAEAQQEAAWQIEGWMGPDGLLCSPHHWLGFRTGRAVRGCDGVEEDIGPVLGSNVWVVGSSAAVLGFERKMIRKHGTTQHVKDWEGTCFDPTVGLAQVRWN